MRSGEESSLPVHDAPSESVRRPLESASDIHRSHLRGSTLLTFGRGVSLLLGMATQVIIVRTLTKADFGAFAFALALAAAARMALSLGQGRALSRFLAAYEERREYPKMFGAILLAVGTILITSVVGIGALYLFSQSLIAPAMDSDEAVNTVLILLFLSPLEAFDQVFVSLFAVFSKPRAIFFRKYVLGPGLRLVVVLILAFTGASVTFLALGYVLAALAGVALYMGLLVGMLRERDLVKEFNPRRVVLPFKAVFGFSLPLIAGDLALLSLTSGGVFVLTIYHSTVEVANYRSVFSAARMNTAVAASFSTLFLPVIARLFARDDIDGVRTSYWSTAAFVAVFTFPAFALTGPLAPSTTVTLFGARYAESATVLSILAVGYYISSILGFNAYALQVGGRIRFVVLVNVLVAVVNIGLCFALAPRFGAVGVAAANCIALVGQNLLNQWALRSTIRTAFVDRRFLWCYGVIIGSAALLWVFQILVKPGFVVSVACAAAASCAVVVTSRRTLQLGTTFPELRRVPLLGRMV